MLDADPNVGAQLRAAANTAAEGRPVDAYACLGDHGTARLPHHTEPVARIDAGNDDLMRYVVRRYAYDPQRRERRHQIVAAFDDEREWAHSWTSRCPAGTGPSRWPVTDPHDHYTGLVLEPGCQRRQQSGRLTRRAVERGC